MTEATESKHPRSLRVHVLVGTHSAACKRKKHEDWQHGMTGCAVGTEKIDHCDCKAHWTASRAGL